MAQGTGSTSLVPLPIKIFLSVAVIGGICGVLVVMGATKALVVVLGGCVVVGLLLLVYKQVLGAMAKARSKPFEKQIRENANKGRKGLAGEANVQDLHSKFAEGLDVFRKHGKDMYSLPWYLLVGEPGSGKTEAVRHSNVGFPGGLQNTLQGLGGTMNMNWWFTNYAVILDTAGRLMFEEVEPGKSSEWKEFLKLLRTSRPNSPVNGLLLVIPADSLIKDGEEEIQRKATRIAQQLGTVRDSLKVRFPAFVIVTKADLINGFREFYDSIDDPGLQHQMMGWSNPESLDQRFEPRRLTEHFSQLADRIRRRRMALLMDPVHTEDPNLRRIDQVDALYAYPEAMQQLVPKLQSYLETIFSSGTWSGDPLFLRGIYFTSSMREGSALDADLAAAIGVPVDALPEGRTWKRERAFFLRDLFISKVFRERGLVLKSKSAKATRALRQLAVFGSAGFTALVLIALTAWGAYSFRSSIGQHLTLWEGVRDGYKTKPEAQASGPMTARSRNLIVQARANEPEFDYLGGEMMDVGVTEFARERLAPEIIPRLDAPIEAPLLYRPLATISADHDQLRNDAFGTVFLLTVVRPTVEAASTRMQLDRRQRVWNAEKFAAARALILLQVNAMDAFGQTEPAGGFAPDDPRSASGFEALLAYAAMPGEGEEGASPPSIDNESLRQGVEWLTSKGVSAEVLVGRRTNLEKPITEGVNAWRDRYDPDELETFDPATAEAEGRALLDAFNAADDSSRPPAWVRTAKARIVRQLEEIAEAVEGTESDG